MHLTKLTRSIALLGGLLIGAIALPNALAAQSALDGPRASAVGVTNAVAMSAITLAPLTPPQDTFSGNGRNVAMMIVGGAAIVVGGMVGGDGGTIIAVTGAVVGLMGLFRYLQ